jgi:hypothetical protein
MSEPTDVNMDKVEEGLQEFFKQFDLNDPTSIIVLEQLFKMLCGK